MRKNNKKYDQSRINKLLSITVAILFLYGIIATYIGIIAYTQTKASLEFLYMNADFSDPNKVD